MASDREIERLRKDTDEWRRLATRLLRYDDNDVLPLKDSTFLEGILDRHWQPELSYRQAEWLIDIRRNVEFVSTYRGYNLRRLVNICHANRFEFDDDDETWIVGIFESRRDTLRYVEARRVYGLARQLGEVDDWAA